MPVPQPPLASGFLDKPDDLTQLTLINADSVRDLAESINRMTADDLKAKKLVILLATGGTLAMKTQDTGVRIPAFHWQELFRPAESLLQGRYEIVGLNVFCIDSSQMNYRHTTELAIVITYLWRNVKVPFLGFLITHGTDTMSYSGAALSLMTGQGLPTSIVMTGSQRPIEDPMSDAPINLRNALCTLEALHDNDMAEVVIVMGNKAILATSAEKVGAVAANAFDAPRHRYVARFDQMDYPVRLAEWLNPRRKVPFAPTIWQGEYAHTLVIKSTMGLNPETLLYQTRCAEVCAVILYSYGTGTVDEAVLQVLVTGCRERALPLFIVSPVNDEYRAEYESASHALQMGAIPLNMTLSAALAKIEIALRLHLEDIPALSRFMTGNYVGEIPSDLSSAATR